MAIITLDCNLNGGDAQTPNDELFYRIYGDIDAYASPIHTTGTALADANVTVNLDNVVINGVDGTTNNSFKIAAVDGEGNEGVLSDAESVYDSDYSAYLNKLTANGTPLPSVPYQEAQSQLMGDIKSSIDIGKVDEIMLFATDAGQASSLQPFYPSTNDVCTITGTVTHNDLTGATSDGVDGIIHSKVVSSFSNFSQDDCCAIGYYTAGVGNALYCMGYLETSPSVVGFHFGNSNTASAFDRNNASTAVGAVNMYLDKFIGMRRNNSANFDSISGITINNRVSASSGMPTTEGWSWIGRSDSVTQLNNTPVLFGYVGASLTDSELSNLRDAISTYETTINSL